MQLPTLWFACCVGLLYSGGCVDGLNIGRPAGRGGRQHHESPSLNDHKQAMDPVTRQTYSYPDDWFIETFYRSHVYLSPARIIIPNNFFQTECPQWMHGVFMCFIFYRYYPETMTNIEDAPPEITSTITEHDDTIDTTTQASELTERPEEFSIQSRFGLQVDFNSYYNTTTGVDLNIVKPLRTPTVKIPPADHSAGAAEISGKPRPAGSATVQHPPVFLQPSPTSRPPTQKKKFNTNFDETSDYPPVTTTRRSKNPTRRNTRTTPVNKIENIPKTTPISLISDNQDEDSVVFDNNESITLKPHTIKHKKSSTARETSPTTSPLIPCTNGKGELTRNYQSFSHINKDESILFDHEESNTEGTTSVLLYEKMDQRDLDEAIKECCKRTTMPGCFEAKGFILGINPCESLLRRGWNENY